jgi:beta-glucanase (GH16 family)
MNLPKGYRNNEEQEYSPGQVQVGDGQLRITATRDGAGAWHSGELHSKWNYTYGDFEVRMALSAVGPGVWPAAWLLGSTDTWPNGGELDMFEAINTDPKAYGTIHGGGPAGHWQLGSVAGGVDVTKYHTYKMSKRPGRVTWYVDGVKRAEWTQAQVPVGGVWPFETHSNFAILNLAIGGTWPGPSSAATPSSVTMMVDWYRVSNGS